MEVKVSVPMYFICMIKKAVKSNITESVRSNIIFINTFLCWICFVFLAKTGQCKRRHFGYSDISFIFHCNVWNYLALEYMLCDLCTLLRNMWAGIGCLFGIVIGLISKAGSSFSEIWDCFLSAFVNLLN